MGRTSGGWGIGRSGEDAEEEFLFAKPSLCETLSFGIMHRSLFLQFCMSCAVREIYVLTILDI